MRKIFVLLSIAVILFSCIEEVELNTKEGNGVVKGKGKFKKYEPKDSTSTSSSQEVLIPYSFKLKK